VQNREKEDILFDIGRRIAELRVERGFTQEQFAEQVGITPQYLQRLEGGKQNLSVGKIVQLAKQLGTTFDDLLSPPTSRKVRPGRPGKKN
jgi:transcriptional regulator with XRE-family HTH domain